MPAKRVVKKAQCKKVPRKPGKSRTASKGAVEEPVLRFFERLAKRRGLTNIHVTEQLDNPGEPVIVDHNAGLFYGVALKRLTVETKSKNGGK